MEDKFCIKCDSGLAEYKFNNKEYCVDCLLEELEKDEKVEIWETKSYMCCDEFVGDTNANSSYEIIDELKTYFEIEELEE